MTGLLDGKVAVITGAASGMGFATAETFVREGARVVLADVQDDLGAAAAARLGDAAVFVHADVTDEVQVAAAIERATAEFGRLDVLFSNAGAGGDTEPVSSLGREGLERTLALNLTSHVYAHKHAARRFLEQGSGGSIITTASAAGVQAGWSAAAYSIAKAGVLGLVRASAFELRGTGVRSNAIVPGIVLTPIITNYFGVSPEDSRTFLDEVAREAAGETLVGRAGEPGDIANAALFLASDLSSWITGALLPVDGGATSATANQTPAIVARVAERFRAS